MILTITRRYTFAASHRLLGLREGHKCARAHGHNYVVDLTVSGREKNAAPGMSIDAADLDIWIGPVLARWDHRDLNEVMPGRSPTVEEIAQEWWRQLAFVGNGSGLTLVRVRVQETERLWAEVTA